MEILIYATLIPLIIVLVFNRDTARPDLDEALPDDAAAADSPPVRNVEEGAVAAPRDPSAI